MGKKDVIVTQWKQPLFGGSSLYFLLPLNFEYILYSVKCYLLFIIVFQMTAFLLNAVDFYVPLNPH